MTSYKDKIKFIKKKCIEADPELQNRGYECSECMRQVIMAGTLVVKYRPIRLGAVLNAIGVKESFSSMPTCINSHGGFYKNGKLMAIWKLERDVLNEQSEGTIDFIYNLLQ